MVTLAKLLRLAAHASSGPWKASRFFSPEVMTRIENAITDCERNHSAEIFFCVEHALPLYPLLRDQTPRERAMELFAKLGVWDTAENNGILFYLLLAERQLEIVTDRGVATKVSTDEWEVIVRQMQDQFKIGNFEEGVKLGLLKAGEMLSAHFPPKDRRENELNNKPVLI